MSNSTKVILAIVGFVLIAACAAGAWVYVRSTPAESVEFWPILVCVLTPFVYAAGVGLARWRMGPPARRAE